MKRYLLPIPFLLLLAAPAGMAQDNLFTTASGYGAQEILESRASAPFAVAKDTLWVNEGDQLVGIRISTEETFFEGELPDQYTGFAAFAELSPAGDQLWLGFTVAENADDRLFRFEIASQSWQMVGTLPGMYDMAFTSEGQAYLSALDPSAPDNPASIWHFDPQGEFAPQKLAEIGGYSAGIDLDPQDNLLIVTAKFFEDGLYRLTSQQLGQALENNDTLRLDQAALLSDLPAAGNDCAVDAAGKVYFSTNPGTSNFIGLWNETTGAGNNYDSVAETDGGNWITSLQVLGSLDSEDLAEGLFIATYDKPFVRLRREAASALGEARVAAFHVFPNPASDFITLDLAEQQNLRFFDALGKMIWQSSALPGQPLDISHLPAGLYWIDSPSGRSQTLVKP